MQAKPGRYLFIRRMTAMSSSKKNNNNKVKRENVNQLNDDRKEKEEEEEEKLCLLCWRSSGCSTRRDVPCHGRSVDIRLGVAEGRHIAHGRLEEFIIDLSGVVQVEDLFQSVANLEADFWVVIVAVPNGEIVLTSARVEGDSDNIGLIKELADTCKAQLLPEAGDDSIALADLDDPVSTVGERLPSGNDSFTEQVDVVILGKVIGIAHPCIMSPEAFQ